MISVQPQNARGSFALWLALIAFCEGKKEFAPLDYPLVRFYGKISYSFYLLHPLSLWSAARVADHVQGLGGVPLTIAALVAALSSVVATTPFAYLSWRFVETPFVRLGKSRAPRKAEVDAIIHNPRRQEA